jgi:hypothetical protein
MPRYFNLAHGTRPIQYATDFPWPYDIDVCFDQVPHPIAFSEGVGHGAAGCAVSASEALQPKWREHFDVTGAYWLLPHIERLAQGLPLPEDEMLHHFQTSNGKLPSSYDSKFA